MFAFKSDDSPLSPGTPSIYSSINKEGFMNPGLLFCLTWALRSNMSHGQRMRQTHMTGESGKHKSFSPKSRPLHAKPLPAHAKMSPNPATSERCVSMQYLFG